MDSAGHIVQFIKRQAETGGLTGEQQVIRTPEIHQRRPEFSYIEFFSALQNRLSIIGALCMSRFGVIVRPHSLISLYVRIIADSGRGCVELGETGEGAERFRWGCFGISRFQSGAKRQK